jgi:replication factor C subunit 2/4
MARSKGDKHETKTHRLDEANIMLKNQFEGTNIKAVTSLKSEHFIKQSWVDKYRPTTLRDIIGNDDIKDLVIETPDDLPHLLLYGPPGTGKTSIAHAIIDHLYGPAMKEHNVLELNASDDNGIGVVRDTIIKFSRLSAGDGDPNYPSPEYKIIILDEADSMTPDAQMALKKAMEKTCDVTRYILICNYEDKIVEAIKSRCAPFRFSPVSKKSIIKKMKNIAKCEKINIKDNKIYDCIADICEGDARRSINTLQNLKYVENDVITLADVHELTSYVDEEYLNPYWEYICDADNVNDILDKTEELASKSYPMDFIVKYLVDKIINTKRLCNDDKAKCLTYLSKMERMLFDGSDTYLQLLSIFTLINSCIHNINVDVHHIY